MNTLLSTFCALLLVVGAHAGTDISTLVPNAITVSIHSVNVEGFVLNTTVCEKATTGDCPDTTAIPAESTITFKWEINEDVIETYNTANPDSTVDSASINKIQLKRCFSPHSKDKRPWRKTKSDISKDKQCKKQFALVDRVAADTMGTVDYTFPAATPGATYFVRAFAKEGDTYVAYGDSDTTQGYFKYESFDGLTDAIKVSVAILSVISWVLLFGYFAYDLRPKAEV